MKAGRNELCACGSGRKHKHCCLHQDSTVVTEGNTLLATVPPSDDATASDMLLSNPFENASDDDIKNLSSVFNSIMNNIHNHKLKKLAHIREYKKLRKTHDEISASMAQYLEEGEFELKLDKSAVKTEIEAMHSKANAHSSQPVHIIDIDFDMDSDEGMQAFYDMHIYKMGINANSITEDFINSRRYRKPEKIAMLAGMHNSVRGLFEIIDVNSDQGHVRLRDVFTGQEFEIIDIGMSHAESKTDIYLYRRVITVGEISFGAGVVLTFEKTDAFVIDFIKRHKADYHPFAEMTRFSELYNYYSTDKNRVEFERLDVRRR